MLLDKGVQHGPSIQLAGLPTTGTRGGVTSYQQIASALLDNSNCDPNTGIIIRGRSYWENPAELENSLTAMLEELSTESTL